MKRIKSKLSYIDELYDLACELYDQMNNLDNNLLWKGIRSNNIRIIDIFIHNI